MTTITLVHPARPPAMEFWRAYLVTMRPYLLFVSGITGIAGLSLGGNISTASVIALGLAFFLSYGFGQALTDCFQIDTDALSSPYRPLVRGTVRPIDVLIVSVVGLTACGIVVATHHPANIMLALLAVGGLASYTWFKRRWWGGPWYNAWIVSSIVLMGYLGATHGSMQWSPALAGSMTVALLAYANFVLAGYFKDVEADRATGYKTLPVVFGRGVAAWASDALAIGAFFAATFALRGGDMLVAALFIVPAAGWSFIAQWRLHGVEHDSEAHVAIGPVVHTYVLLLAGIAVAHQPTWIVWIVPFVATYALTMRARPMAAQI